MQINSISKSLRRRPRGLVRTSAVGEAPAPSWFRSFASAPWPSAAVRKALVRRVPVSGPPLAGQAAILAPARIGGEIVEGASELFQIVLDGSTTGYPSCTAPRQSGKTTMSLQLVDMLNEQSEEDVIAIYVSLQPIVSPEVKFSLATPEQEAAFNNRIIKFIQDELPEDVLPEPVLPNRSFIRFLTDISAAYAKQGKKFVIVLDEWDSMARGHKFASGWANYFLSSLRNLYHNSRRGRPAPHSVILVGATHPHNYEAEGGSPFNIAMKFKPELWQASDVEEFGAAYTRAACNYLTQRYPDESSNYDAEQGEAVSDSVIERIMYWSNGHPQLVARCLAGAVAAGPSSEGAVEAVDRAANGIVSERQAFALTVERAIAHTVRGTMGEGMQRVYWDIWRRQHLDRSKSSATRADWDRAEELGLVIGREWANRVVEMEADRIVLDTIDDGSSADSIYKDFVSDPPEGVNWEGLIRRLVDRNLLSTFASQHGETRSVEDLTGLSESAVQSWLDTGLRWVMNGHGGARVEREVERGHGKIDHMVQVYEQGKLQWLMVEDKLVRPGRRLTSALHEVRDQLYARAGTVTDPGTETTLLALVVELKEAAGKEQRQLQVSVGPLGASAARTKKADKKAAKAAAKGGAMEGSAAALLQQPLAHIHDTLEVVVTLTLPAPGKRAGRKPKNADK